MKRRLTIALTLGAIIGVLAIALQNGTRWGGSCGYNQLEYELTFRDAKGNPVEGVELKVEDPRGNDCFCFPVTDYVPAHAIVSDKNGVMRFHHVYSSSVEWDIWGRDFFGLYRVVDLDSPEYQCRFLHQGKEVHRTPYGKLPNWDWEGQGWEAVPKVTRRWDWPAVTPVEIIHPLLEPEEQYSARLERFFHIDKNNKQRREGKIACRNACRRFLEAERELFDKARAAEDLEFPVIRRTITLAVCGRK